MRQNMGYGGGYHGHYNHMQHHMHQQHTGHHIPGYGGHLGQQPPRVHPQQNNGMNKHGQKRGRSWEDLQSRPTSVLFLRNVQETSDDRILAQLCAPFGAITQCLHMLEKRSAFVQFERFEDAQRCLEHYQNHPPKLFGRVVKFAWSGREKIKMPDIPFPKSNPPSQVLHLQISLIKHSVSLEMCKQLMGDGLQKVSIREPLCGEGSIIVLAQMCDIETAKDTQTRLEGKYIYSGCNRIAATYSHLSQLDIPCNSSWAHDFLRQPDLNGQDTRSLYWKQQQAWQSPVPPVQLRPSGSNTPPIPNRHQSATAQLYNTKQNGFAGAPVSNRANVHLLSNGGRNSVPSSDYGPVTRPVAVLDIPAANTVDLESSPYQNFGNNAIEIQSSPSPSPEPVAADTQQRKLTISAIAENPIEYSVPPPSVVAAQHQAPPALAASPHDAPLLSYQPPAKQMYRGNSIGSMSVQDQVGSPLGAHTISPGSLSALSHGRAASLGAPAAHDVPLTQQVMINPEGSSVCLLQGLHDLATPAELATLFAVYGNVVAVKILADQRSVGLVQLQTEEQSRAAVKHLNGIRYHGLSVRVEPSAGKGLPPMRPDADPRFNLFVSNNREYTRHPMDKPLRSFPPSTNLFIMNLPVKVSEAEICDRIMQLSGLRPVEIQFSMDKKAVNVHFATLDEAVTCLTKCGVQALHGRAMRIGFGVPKRAGSSPTSPPPVSSASPIITKQPAYHEYSFTGSNSNRSTSEHPGASSISNFSNAAGATPSTTASGSVLGALPASNTPTNFGMSTTNALASHVLGAGATHSKEILSSSGLSASPDSRGISVLGASPPAAVAPPALSSPGLALGSPGLALKQTTPTVPISLVDPVANPAVSSTSPDTKEAVAGQNPVQYDVKTDATNSPTRHRRASVIGRMNKNFNANSNNPAGVLPGLTEKSQRILQDSAFADISDAESVCSE